MGGTGELILTGQLGEVMQESVRTALSYIRSHASELELEKHLGGSHHRETHRGNHAEKSLLEHTDVHVHFPAGSTHKDGPSAGVAILVALASLFTGRLTRSDTAMSGEITLRGSILPVGGIHEKVLAAHRAGLRRLILPVHNEKDLHELPEAIRREMSIIFAKSAEDVLANALEPQSLERAPRKGVEAPEDAQGGGSIAQETGETAYARGGTWSRL